jgi:isopenicillin N synthase-like dioxygenase
VQALIEKVAHYAPELFSLPQAIKDRLTMRNSAAFFGYTRFGTEITKGAIDQREQFDFAEDFENEWSPGKEEYLRMWGNAQVRSLSSTCLNVSILFQRASM